MGSPGPRSARAGSRGRTGRRWRRDPKIRGRPAPRARCRARGSRRRAPRPRAPASPGTAQRLPVVRGSRRAGSSRNRGRSGRRGVRQRPGRAAGPGTRSDRTAHRPALRATRHGSSTCRSPARRPDRSRRPRGPKRHGDDRPIAGGLRQRADQPYLTGLVGRVDRAHHDGVDGSDPGTHRGDLRVGRRRRHHDLLHGRMVHPQRGRQTGADGRGGVGRGQVGGGRHDRRDGRIPRQVQGTPSRGVRGEREGAGGHFRLDRAMLRATDAFETDLGRRLPHPAPQRVIRASASALPAASMDPSAAPSTSAASIRSSLS